MAVLGGAAISCERGTPVSFEKHTLGAAPRASPEPPPPSLQGYPAHEQHLLPSAHHDFLGTGLLVGSYGGGGLVSEVHL